MLKDFFAEKNTSSSELSLIKINASLIEDMEEKEILFLTRSSSSFFVELLSEINIFCGLPSGNGLTNTLLFE